MGFLHYSNSKKAPGQIERQVEGQTDPILQDPPGYRQGSKK